MHVNKAFAMNVNDAQILKENAKRLGLTESSFIKLCILIGSKELGLQGDYSFRYSYLKWFKPDELIKEIRELVSEKGKESKETQNEDQKKDEKKDVRKPKIQL